jgi:hypothetical protein
MWSTAQQEHYKSQKYGLPKALFLTPRCNLQRGVDFLPNNSAKIRKISISLLGISIETRIRRLVKKNGS